MLRGAAWKCKPALLRLRVPDVDASAKHLRQHPHIIQHFELVNTPYQRLSLGITPRPFSECTATAEFRQMLFLGQWSFRGGQHRLARPKEFAPVPQPDSKVLWHQRIGVWVAVHLHAHE